MATHDIFMPALSSTMTEGKIVEWLKKPGEKVSRGESVLVVESDKADMDVESFHDGYLAAVLMPAGSSAPVGETIGLVVETESEIASVQAKNPSADSSSSPADTASKPSAPNSPPEAVDPSVSDAKQSSRPAETPTLENLEPVVSPSTSKNNGRVVATPRARKLAAQKGLDLSALVGSGPHGRIQEDDVQKAIGQPVSIPWVAESNAPASSTFSDNFFADKSISSKTSEKSKESVLIKGNSFGSPGESVPFNTLQQAVNRNMEASLTVPCFRVGYSITTDKLDAFYQQVKPRGVTMTALLAKAVAKTLGDHPQVNAACSADGMAYPGGVNIAVAVAMEDGGLITPVLQNANETDLFELSRQWSDLVKRSRNKQLQPDEYSTGTFTLSNLGMFGVDRFDAILPPGTGAILAVGASKPTVVAGQDGSIAVKSQMQVNLTADHRVVYGADGAAFLKALARLIEASPESLAS